MGVSYLVGSPVVSVNGDDGPAVTLDAAEVGADVSGAAAAALTAANAFTTAAVNAALASIAPGAWIGTGLVANGLVELAAAWTADVSGTYFPVNFRQGAYGKLEGSGCLNTSSAYTSGATIFTLPVALRPAANLRFDVRVGGVGAAATFLTIAAATGIGSLSTSFAAGASFLQLDPINGRRTV